MKRKTGIKISRGRLEEDRRKSEDKFEYQRVMLVMLPIIMVAVLVIGVYFGYLSYQDDYVEKITSETRATATQPELSEKESRYLLTVVSSANTIDESFVPKLSEYNGVQVSTLMLDDLKLMLSDAAADGMNIEVVEGYISFKEQKETYDKAVKAYKKKHKCSTVKAEAAVKKKTPNAGECEQQTGLIVKLSDGTDESFKKTAEYRWLMKNGVEYGFILRYPDKVNTGSLVYNANLFRYVGVDNAKLMRAYNMNLDEYIDYLNLQ